MEYSDLSGLVDKLKTGKLDASELAEEHLERIKNIDSEINAFISINEDVVKDAKKAQGENKPLAGVPIAVKDNMKVRGLKTTYGSKLYEQNIPKEDSIIVERLKEAGAVILGKTNLPEFSLISYTDNRLIGETKNPWDTSRTVGGSSGGSGAAVLSGMAPAATGSDGGGSIRIPASFCGLYGLKPSYGRVPFNSRIPIFDGLSSKGFLTRTVEDTALLLDLVKGKDIQDNESLPRDKDYRKSIDEDFSDLKIAYSPDLGYAKVDSEVEKIVKEAAYSLEKVGQVDRINPEIPNLESQLMNKIIAETKNFLQERKEEWKEKCYPPFKFFLKMAEDISLEDYVNVNARRAELWNSLTGIFEEYDFLLTPTVAIPPYELGDIGVDEINGEEISTLGWMPFTYPFNFTEQPAASIPAGFTSSNLPVGMQIVGKPLDDSGVLRLSKRFQDINPWQDKYKEINNEKF